MLIDAEVFAALTTGARPGRAPSPEALARQLADAPVAPQARAMLGEATLAGDADRSVVSAALTQLATLTRWLAAQDRSWSPVAETGQFGPDDDLKFAREARATLAASAALVPVLDRRIAALEQENADW